MTLRRHILALASTITALSGGPTLGAEAGAAGDGARIALTGAERWRLRPAEVQTTGSTVAVPSKGGQALEVPEGRRAVRVVYPGLGSR